MHQSQMQININAYGLVEMNAATYAKVYTFKLIFL